MATIARRTDARPSSDVAPLDVVREISLARRMTDEAVARYEAACEVWEAMSGEQQVFAQSEGMRPPHTGEVTLCLDLTGKLQTRLAAIEGRDAVSIDALLGFMTQVRALVTQFVPDEATQKGLLAAIQSLDIRS